MAFFGHASSQRLQNMHFCLSIFTSTIFCSMTTCMASVGQLSWHAKLQARLHLFTSTSISLVRVGKASASTTGILSSPFVSIFMAFSGHRTAHSPQNVHLSGSMSMKLFFTNLPLWTIAGKGLDTAFSGHIFSQISHPTQSSRFRVRT